ncbi:MAG: hypothetical protein ACKOPS_25990 [Cyanobium sp.]
MPERSLRSLLALQVLVPACLCMVSPALAQTESFLLGPGSKVGPATEVKPKNCVTAPDGTVTCDTELVNPPGDTRAQPQFDLFRN